MTKKHVSEEKSQNIDISNVVYQLNNAFASATSHFNPNKNYKGTDLYNFQVDFSWLIHEITNGPQCFIWKNVDDVNALIEKVKSHS